MVMDELKIGLSHPDSKPNTLDAVQYVIEESSQV